MWIMWKKYTLVLRFIYNIARFYSNKTQTDKLTCDVHCYKYRYIDTLSQEVNDSTGWKWNCCYKNVSFNICGNIVYVNVAIFPWSKMKQ